MTGLQFWKAVTKDESAFLEGFLGLLEEHKIRYCVIGGQGVNAYVEPFVSLDLDIVVAIDQLAEWETLLREKYRVEAFPRAVNVRLPGSKLNVQIQTDPCYFDFPDRAEIREVLDLYLPVAGVADVLQGKVWAAMQPARRASKRQKDLADISRLLESYPHLRAQVPEQILQKLI